MEFKKIFAVGVCSFFILLGCREVKPKRDPQALAATRSAAATANSSSSESNSSDSELSGSSGSGSGSGGSGSGGSGSSGESGGSGSSGGSGGGNTTVTYADGTGGNGINHNTTTGISSLPVLASNSNGNLFAAWLETDGTTACEGSACKKVRVAKFNENANSPGWSLIDGGTSQGININNTLDSSAVSIVATNTNLFVAWTEHSGEVYQVRVKRYNITADTWHLLRTIPLNINNGANAYTPNVFLTTQGYLGLTWTEVDSNCGDSRTLRFRYLPITTDCEGATCDWTQFNSGRDGGSLNYACATGVWAFQPSAVLFDSADWIAWIENSYTANTVGAQQIRVARVWTIQHGVPVFTGNKGTTGINKNTSLHADQPKLTVHNSTLYAIWQEKGPTADYGYQIRVAKFNGQNAWSFIDGNNANYGINKDSAKTAANPGLVSNGTSLYAYWVEVGANNKYQLRVAKYNGNDANPAWSIYESSSTSGLNKEATQDANNPSFTLLGSAFYGAWAESSQINILKLLPF